MADDENMIGADADAASEEGGEQQPKKSKKKLIIIGAVALLVLGGGGAAAFFMLSGDKAHEEGEHHAQAHSEAVTDPIFYDMPDMLVNLNGGGNGGGFLKLSVTLEVASEEDKARLEQVLPRVQNQFQTYLRELRAEDLKGSAGLQRLKEELLYRVNQAVHPARVHDVLFGQMIVQNPS